MTNEDFKKALNINSDIRKKEAEIDVLRTKISRIKEARNSRVVIKSDNYNDTEINISIKTVIESIVEEIQKKEREIASLYLEFKNV